MDPRKYNEFVGPLISVTCDAWTLSQDSHGAVAFNAHGLWVGPYAAEKAKRGSKRYGRKRGKWYIYPRDTECRVRAEHLFGPIETVDELAGVMLALTRMNK